MNAYRLFAAAAAAIALCAYSPAHDAFAREVLSDAELEDARGGVLIAGELAFEFGAVVRTYEGGVLAIQTQVTWTTDGPVFEQFAGPGVNRITDAEMAFLSGAGDLFRTPGGALVVHDVTQGQLINLLLNTQSNLDLKQQTDITIVLPGFEAVQGDMARNLMGMRLMDDLAAGGISAVY